MPIYRIQIAYINEQTRKNKTASKQTHECIHLSNWHTLIASIAYSTWKIRPSGEKVFTPRSYSVLKERKRKRRRSQRRVLYKHTRVSSISLGLRTAARVHATLTCSETSWLRFVLLALLLSLSASNSSPFWMRYLLRLPVRTLPTTLSSAVGCCIIELTRSRDCTEGWKKQD